MKINLHKNSSLKLYFTRLNKLLVLFKPFFKAVAVYVSVSVSVETL